MVTGVPSPTAAALEACWGLTPQRDNRAVPENPMGTGIGKALLSPPHPAPGCTPHPAPTELKFTRTTPGEACWPWTLGPGCLLPSFAWGGGRSHADWLPAGFAELLQ